MTSIDNIGSSSNRLRLNLNETPDPEFLLGLEQFCKAREMADILPDIQRIIENKTDFDIAYMMLRPECAFGTNLPGFADTSAFDICSGSSAFGMNSRELGIELFAVVRDRNAKRGRLNLCLVLPPNIKSTSGRELRRLTRAIADINISSSRGDDLSKEDFLSRLIHQVRNPLATILISASQMAMKADDRFDDDDRMLVDFINSESEKIEYYLSKYSKYALAKRSELIDVDAAGLMEIVKNSCGQENLPGGRIAFTISDGIGNVRIKLDPEQITAALQELIDNAREATSEKKEKISISIRREDKSIQIIICDNGPGIRPEMLRKVKEPFFSTKDGGSGLGLSIADNIITMHGGIISIDSMPGKGTRFTVSLPCK